MHIDFDNKHVTQIYRNEYTGEILPFHLVKQAMAEELAYFNSTVWQAVDLEDAKHTPNTNLSEQDGWCVTRATSSIQTCGRVL